MNHTPQLRGILVLKQRKMSEQELGKIKEKTPEGSKVSSLKKNGEEWNQFQTHHKLMSKEEEGNDWGRNMALRATQVVASSIK